MEKLEALPDSDNCVHFDLHSSNIMMQNGELVIIDMGDFSTGSYLFDLGLIYMIYGVPELGLSMLATKIPTEEGLAFWNHFAGHYFADKSAEERALWEENRYFLASLRLIYSVTFLPGLRSELERWIKDILLPRIMATRRAA
jgi:aminoglycoside phosphotransferase (APT) family kinase protein